MPTIDQSSAVQGHPASRETAASPAAREQGFATALAAATRGGWLTLGEMVGLDPLPPGALPSGALPSAASAAGAQSALGAAGEPGAHPVIGAAEAYLGVPYQWGGTDPATGLDCSGLVQRAFADIGIDVPRVSADQARAGAAVDSLEQARPGDLVYWAGRGGRPNHIGIYLGGGEMLHAPRTGEVVQVADVRTAPPDAIRRVG